jgi:protein involved in polysaccharide export with SLBB domain
MVTLSNIRSIKVNIVGEVKTPGTYQLPSFTTSFNALYAAGGPTVKGSFRNVQVYRGGKQIAEVDLYDFLLKGKTDKNIRLEDNDVLLVPQYGKRVEIVGEVRRNFYFEIKEKETIVDLIEMANGFTTNAYQKLITIQRFNGTDKSILNIDEKEQASTKLNDGDYVIVGKNPNRYKNRIQVVGSVQQEGDYEFIENLRIDKLVELAGGLKPEAFTNRAILYRTEKNMNQISVNIDLSRALKGDTVNNILLQKEDLLVVSNMYDLHENYFVSIEGEVNKPGIYPYTKGITLKQLILESKGFNDAASGTAIEIIRRNKDDNTSIAKIIKIEIGKDLTVSKNDINLQLDPFDHVFIRASIGYREFKKVYVQGEAKYPGQFLMDKANMTIGDLVKRAEGVLPSADINGAILIRRTIFFKKDRSEDANLINLLELKSRYEDSTKSGFTEVKQLQIKKINQQIDDLYLKKFKNEDKTVDIGNLVNSTNTLSAKQDSLNRKERTKTIQENIEELKTSLQARIFKNLRDVNVDEDQYQFVSINLGKIIDTKSSKKYDVQLQEGDILYIPTFNETVGVGGEVLYPVAVKYIEGMPLNSYVNQAGGFNVTALRKRSYVVEANGSVKRTRNLLWFKFYPSVGPGSMVFVPKNNKPASTFNLDRVLGLVSSLVTTYLLVKNLSK